MPGDPFDSPPPRQVPPPHEDAARHLAMTLDDVFRQHGDNTIAAALDRLDDTQLARLRRCLNAVGRH